MISPSRQVMSSSRFTPCGSFWERGALGRRPRNVRVNYQDAAIINSENEPNIISETKKEIALRELDPERANIVRWHDDFTHGPTVELQSLHDYMDEKNYEPLPLSNLRAVVQQMSTALLHLETVGVMHCNIKPQNIMVVDHTQRLKVKLSDFGLAQHMSERSSFAGTLSYQAPEVLLGLGYSEEIDMWALGVCMAELAIGAALYPGHHPYDVIKFIVDTQGLPPDYLLRVGPNTNHCFELRRVNGLDTWTLKTPELILTKTGHEFCDTREVVLSCLEDIMEMMDTNRNEKEGRDFVDLVKSMMCLDPEQRIRPHDVLKHPFLEEDNLDLAAEPLVCAEENMDVTEDLIPIIQEAEEAAAIQPEAETETRTRRRPLTQAFRSMLRL